MGKVGLGLLLSMLFWVSDANACFLFRGRFRRGGNCHCHNSSTNYSRYPTQPSYTPSTSTPRSTTPGPSTTRQSEILNKNRESLHPTQAELKDYLSDDEAGRELLLKWKEQSPSLNVNQLALLLALREAGSSKIQGRFDPYLCHWGRTVSSDGNKITAYSWPDDGSSLLKNSRTCTKRWQDSPRHAQLMMSKHNRYCVNMERATDGSFFCSIVYSR